MTDLTRFFNTTIPDILRAEQLEYKFVVVGGRAIKSYIDTQRSSIEDWDLLVIGSPETQVKFTADLNNVLKAKGYDTRVELIEPEHKYSEFNMRSRPWFRLSINVHGDFNVTVFDVYQAFAMVDGYVVKNGIKYSNMGFLIRELARSEKHARELIDNAANLDTIEIENKLENIDDLLEDNAILADILDGELDDLEYVLDRTATNEVQQELEQAKNKIMNIIKDRELLFGFILSGKGDKELTHNVCKACKEIEQQYNKLVDLQNKCKEVLKSC